MFVLRMLQSIFAIKRCNQLFAINICNQFLAFISIQKAVISQFLRNYQAAIAYHDLEMKRPSNTKNYIKVQWDNSRQIEI